jgi:hypothetical protein
LVFTAGRSFRQLERAMMNPIEFEITDFPNDKYNAAVLTREIGDQISSADLLAITQNSSVQFLFTTDISAGDETILDDIVSNHDGADFTSEPYEDISEQESNDDSGNEIVTVHIDDIMPYPGEYTVFAYQELATTTNDGTHISKGRMHVTKNGNKIERAEAHNDQNLFQPMCLVFPFSVQAGDVFTFEMTFERMGADTGNPARVQRSRLSVKKT